MRSKKKLLWAAVAAAVLTIPARANLSFGQATQFFPLAPCRVVDTRNITPPKLSGGQTRSFSVKGSCGVPNDASAISYNLTAINPTVQGHFRIFPHGVTMPNASAVNFIASSVIANGGVVSLSGGSPDLSLFLNAGQADAALDVTGYFK